MQQEQFLLHGSVPSSEIIIMFGRPQRIRTLNVLQESNIWYADGTLKDAVPMST